MEENLLAMQQAAEQRVRRMRERSRQLCAAGPTFGAGAVTAAKPAAQQPCSRGADSPSAADPTQGEPLLLLLLVLLLAQGGCDRTLLILLAYLAM